jgi:hypothetical protein
VTTATLSDADRTILELERALWLYPGQKEAAIRDRVDMTTVAFYQRLNTLIDTEAALAHDPVLVRRLLRVRAQRIRR